MHRGGLLCSVHYSRRRVAQHNADLSGSKCSVSLQHSWHFWAVSRQNKDCLCCAKGRSTCSNPFCSPRVWCGFVKNQSTGRFYGPVSSYQKQPVCQRVKRPGCNKRLRLQQQSLWRGATAPELHTDPIHQVFVINTHRDAAKHIQYTHMHKWFKIWC